MKKKWRIKENDENKIKEISNKFNISKLVAMQLVNKKLSDEEIGIFLNPTRKDFHNPFDLPDMEKAVNRIVKAIEKKEKIIIYGDYDADGITSTSIIKRYMRDRGIDVGTYIPNRISEGYGLNIKAIENIANEGYNLIITVDCGITSIKEVNYANELGLDVVITDHHEVGEELPNAIAVVDAKRKDSIYPFNALAGCGVAFKLIQAISIKLNLQENEWLKYIDIACIGTISDIVPLIDENRVIAKLGLKLLEVTRNTGLKYLLQMISPKKIDSGFVSFAISPRINACGRMGHQEEALNLFLTEDPIEARKLSQSLEDYNKQRQDIEKNIYNQAVQMLANTEEKGIIVLGSDGWHHGVIGIVSSKITEMTYKPSVLICFEKDEGKGSGRSIEGFDLYYAVSQSKQYLEAFGGHEMAIGLSIKKENFENFKKELEKFALEKNVQELKPEIVIDKVIDESYINIKTIDELDLLEPYGESNEMPLILYKNLRIVSIRTLSEGKHLKLVLADGNTILEAVGFGMGEISNEIQMGDKIDVVGNIAVNRFRNTEAVQITIKDLRISI